MLTLQLWNSSFVPVYSELVPPGDDERGPRKRCNSDTMGPETECASSLDHTSSPSLWRVKACVFGVIMAPENAVRHILFIVQYMPVFFIKKPLAA